MAKNRKYRSAALRFGPALKAFFLCLLIGGSAVGYVWQKNQISQLWLAKARSEKRLSEAKRLNQSLAIQLNKLRGRNYLMQKLKDYNVVLVEPSRSQIWVLPEPSREPVHPTPETQYALQENGDHSSQRGKP